MSPRPYDARTLRTMRLELGDIVASWRKEGARWRLNFPVGKDPDYASGVLSAAADLDDYARALQAEEKRARARPHASRRSWSKP